MRVLATIFWLAWCAAPVCAANVDCRTCHLAVDPANPAPDFSEYFNNINREHHATGVPYPQQLGLHAELNRPDGFASGIEFFDANHNGLPDANEIQLFGNPNSATVECSSCHIEHGTAPRPIGAPVTDYLRVNNDNSALCTVCHKY